VKDGKQKKQDKTEWRDFMIEHHLIYTNEGKEQTRSTKNKPENRNN
jgi:hypothetical protein